MNMLSVRDTALGRGLRELLAKFEERVGPTRPIEVFLAGGMAVHLYVGKRVTTDVDAEFSARVYVPSDLIVPVTLEDGTTKVLHFDTNYNSTFALMHEDYTRDAIQTDVSSKMVRLKVLAPVDLAVSKIARFMDLDKEDIRDLVAARLTTANEIEKRATAALEYFVGGANMIRLNVRDAVKIAQEAEAFGASDKPPRPKPPRM